MLTVFDFSKDKDIMPARYMALSLELGRYTRRQTS